MSRTPQTREIDGVRFEVTPLGFGASKRLFVRLSKALGPSLATLAEAPSLRSIPLARAATSALEGLSEDDLDHAAEVLGEVTRYSLDGGKKWPYLNADEREALFSERDLLLYFKWLGFALEVNYAPFFAAFKKASAAARAQGTQTP